ncbi:glutamine amidotransferase [Curtobacterium sp. MWU13-2055]|uniref:glutamine amidotransferase n=1 Tax=Curtobacterium sp. MWU13-2055 TaxID=2931928 RepID=UPI00200EDBF9|nr:glutamine amidotransferase [Curtobacterium sp. MWU13-2055]
MSKVLLAGESWLGAALDIKGFDSVPRAQLEYGADHFISVLRSAGHEVTYIPTHEAAVRFPETREDLDVFDVVVLSDIGANTLLLHPRVFNKGERRPNRLKLLAEWVRDGGGLMMAGGYMSFQGFGAKANYHRSPLEAVLPVQIHPFDDRVESPEGVQGETTGLQHTITDGLDAVWPALLGYQELIARDDADVLATIDGHPLLAVRSVDAGKSLAFASDVSPHWAPEEFMQWPGYATLFDRAITWLATH